MRSRLPFSPALATLLALAMVLAIPAPALSAADPLAFLYNYWDEGYQIPPLNSITTPERLRMAQIITVNNSDLTSCGPPECPATGYLLDVHEWDRFEGTQSTGDPPLCFAEPLWGQATPGRRCSGMLVGEDLVLSAGHCNAASDCSAYSVVFDFEMKSPNDPIGDPSNGTVFLSEDQVFGCAEVVENPYAMPAGADEEYMDEIFSLGEVQANDYAVLRLESPVPATRIPVPIERSEGTIPGDRAICLTHPARLPLKAELSNISVADATAVTAGCYVLGGSSGGGVVNLETGRVVGHAVTGARPYTTGNAPPGCVQPCFSCFHDTSAQRTLFAAHAIPWIGLQVVPETNRIDWYGPPTVPSDFQSRTFALTADAVHSRPVVWDLQPPEISEFLTVSGPVAGTLMPGDVVGQVLEPSSTIVEEQGVFTRTSWHRDLTYQSQQRIFHTFYVGVEGFDVVPLVDFMGEGPGALPHETAQFNLTNRWVVAQDLEVSANVSWATLNGLPGPAALTLPASGGTTVTLGFNPLGLSRGLHTGTLTWTSLDSGAPYFERSVDFGLDVGREVFGGVYSQPVTYSLPTPTSVVEIPLTFNSPIGGTIADADILVYGAAGTLPQPGKGARIVLDIVSPDGDVVELDIIGGSHALTYDDGTRPPSAGSLGSLNGGNAYGTWKLRLSRHPAQTEPVTGEIQRFEVRLYIDGGI